MKWTYDVWFLQHDGQGCALEVAGCRRQLTIYLPTLTPADCNSDWVTLTGQILTNWKMWVVTALLHRISKNMLTQTDVRNENYV